MIAKLAFAPGRARAWNVAAASILTAVPFLWFALLTLSYTPVWRNSESLWTHAVRTSHDDRAAAYLSVELIRQGRFAEAERVLTQANALGSAGYMSLAFLHLRNDRAEEALRATDRAIEAERIQPLAPVDRAKLLTLRGSALAKLQRGAEAAEAWRSALALDPDNARARAALDAQRNTGAGTTSEPAP